MSETTNQLPTSLGQTLGKADFAQRPMSLRKFLEPFDHSSLTDLEAGEKYASYKASFAKQQLEDFFEKHKNHAWFREKYHPDVRSDPNINRKLCQRRLDIFMDLHKQGVLDKIALHNGNEAAIVKLLDTVAVKLAGGTDEDVRFLDEFKYPKPTPKASVPRQNSQRSKAQRDRREVQAATEDMTEDTGNVDNEAKHKLRSKTRTSTDRRLKPKAKKQKSNQKNVEKKHAKEAHERLSRSRSGGSDRSQSRSASGSRSSSSSSSTSSQSSSSSSDDDDSSSSSDTNSQSGSSSSGSESSSRSSSSASSRSRSGSEVADTNPDVDKPVVKPTARKRDKRVSRGRDSSSGDDGSESPRDRIPTKKKGGDRQTKRSSAHAMDHGDTDSDQTGLVTSKPGTEIRTVNTAQDQQPAAAEDEEQDGPPVVHRRPIHHTSVLYFPHIPINVYQKDIIALLSTSPLFIRFAVLDPCVMPASDKLGQSNEPLFNPDVDSSSSPGIALRRVGWASFAAQTIDPATGTLTEVDLDAIKTNLVQRATEAEAPTELVDCLRLSRPLPDPMRRPATDRVRSTGPALLTSTLLKHCPSRLYSKGVLRRHLVLAARLADEFDKARGLWATEKTKLDLSRNGTPLVTEPMINGVKEGPDVESHNDSSLLEQNCSTDLPDVADEIDETQDHDDDQINKPDKTTQSAQTAASILTSDTIDPGEDLVNAATMLGMLVSENPFLNGLTDYLVDEGNAEEELLLSGGFQAMSFLPGIAVPVGVGAATIPCADNTEMLQVLDRIILYLRIVHSVDFYAPALYVNEDAMPHPCQLLHVRPSKAQLNKALSRFVPQGTEHPSDTSSQETLFANQLRRMIRLVRPLSESDCVKLGLRDVEEVVEAFVKANTRRKKRKTDVIWVCPLSDKKFRDPIYVKKHIMNKHMEKVEAVKKDTAFFFNNYLLDPMRPQLPLEPHLPNKRRRSHSRADSRHREPVPSEMPAHVDNNHRERSGTDQSGTQRWYGARRFREDTANSRPFYPSNPFGRDYGPGANSFTGPSRPYGRMPYFPPRLPFHNQRGRYFDSGQNYTGVRHGFQRRPYVDLDAP